MTDTRKRKRKPKPNAASVQQIVDATSAEVQKLAALPRSVYETKRKAAAGQLGMRASVLDKMVKDHRAQAEQKEATLAHWNIEPSRTPVESRELLDGIKQVFKRYIVLPKGADDALALWVLHAWTMDAGDISPFIVLVSPTKRCGKTNTLIVLNYLTPKSELASNISPSALFRYVEETRPTLLIDEADSFVGGNEELRGILNSGHTRAAAYVIRNVEVNGEHKPRRFSTWAPKAIATIRELADTLQDRSIVVSLQRKPKTATVARLRQRDSGEFEELRGKAARWARDSLAKLVDADPSIPAILNDRAADNWRPLLAIADLAGGDWPARARESACLLSGDGHDSAANIRLLGDVRDVFPDADVIRSDDLIEKLTADPEKPWAEWHHGKALTQRQLAGLLRPFHVFSETVHPPGLPHGKGYKRTSFEEAWERYLGSAVNTRDEPRVNPGGALETAHPQGQPHRNSSGQNARASYSDAFHPCKRASADETGTSRIFSSVQEPLSHASKNGKLSYSHAGLHPCTDRKGETGPANDFDQEKSSVGGRALSDDLEIPAFLRRY